MAKKDTSPESLREAGFFYRGTYIFLQILNNSFLVF